MEPQTIQIHSLNIVSAFAEGISCRRYILLEVEDVGENLNSCLRRLTRIDTERVMKVTPKIMNIGLTWSKVHKEIDKTKASIGGWPG